MEVPTINYHLKEIYKNSELTEEATIRKIRIVQHEGERDVERELDFYHLKAILAVGYRVNSEEASHFRKWATNTLDEFVTKGYVLDNGIDHMASCSRRKNLEIGCNRSKKLPFGKQY